MHKKIKTVLTVVLCILSITALCFALTACVTHKHTAADAWQSDASGHWHECTANDGAKLDEAQHDFEWVDVTPATCLAKGTQVQKCKTCNFEGESREVDKADHQLEVKHNDSKHWQECSVCHEKFNEADHNVTSEWKKDETGHWHGCTGCDVVTDFAEHELEINADKTAFECKECGYSEEHTHNYTYAYDGPAGHHGICEECGDTTAVVAHRNGDSNGKCIDDGNTHYYMCADCERKVSASHTYGEYLDDGEGSHYRKCNDCDNEMDHVAHTASEVIGSAGAAGHTAKCETCQIEYIAAHDLHTVSDEAEGHHSKCSACDYTTETVAHNLSYKTSAIYGNHYQQCSDVECNYRTEDEAHTGEIQWNDEESFRICDKCNTKYSSAAHNMNLEYDDDTHYMQCIISGCEYIDESTRVAHDIDESVWASFSTIQGQFHYNPCSGCTVKHNREECTQGGFVVVDSDYHVVVCVKHDVGCTYVFASTKSQHNFGEKQTDDLGKEYYICSNCGYETEHQDAADHQHIPDSEWHIDGTWHWHICTVEDCGEMVDRAQHIFPLNDGWFEGESCDICKQGVYEFDASTGTITKYIGNFDKLRIPSSIGGVTVVALGKSGVSNTLGAFYQATFTQVEIPATVTTINSYAFRATNIIELYVPETVQSINAGAFRESPNLRKVRVDAPAIAGSQAFYQCTSLEEVICGEKLKSIANNVFYDCTSLRKIVFESETMIEVTGSNAFKNVTDLTVYYKFSKAVYDETKLKSNDLKNATIKFYYEQRPSTQGGETDVLDSEAWHYNGKGEIELWSESDD